MSVALKGLVAALLLGGGTMAMAANDGQMRVNQLLKADPQYVETWQRIKRKNACRNG